MFGRWASTTGPHLDATRDRSGFGTGKGEVEKAGKAVRGVAIRGLVLEAALCASQYPRADFLSAPNLLE